jgi:hypothetical protein
MRDGVERGARGGQRVNSTHRLENPLLTSKRFPIDTRAAYHLNNSAMNVFRFSNG